MSKAFIWTTDLVKEYEKGAVLKRWATPEEFISIQETKSNDSFQWDDEKVKDYAEWYRHNQGNPPTALWGKDLFEYWKQSHTPKPQAENKPEPQKILTTEDGVALVGQKGYVLSTDMWTFSSCILPENPFYGDHNQFKYFHSKEAAEKYIADNKPQPQKEEQGRYQYVDFSKSPMGEDKFSDTPISATITINEKSKPTEQRIEVKSLTYARFDGNGNWVYELVTSGYISGNEEMGKVKQAIEQVLNDDRKTWFQIHEEEMLYPKTYFTKTQVDELCEKAREEGFNIARELHEIMGSDSELFARKVRLASKYSSYQDYKQQLNQQKP